VVKFVLFVGLLIVILKYHIQTFFKVQYFYTISKINKIISFNAKYILLTAHLREFIFIGLLDLKISMSAAHSEYLINYKLSQKPSFKI